MRYAFISLLLIVMLFSGCVNLNKEVKELNAHDKQLIYKSIKNEIRLYHRKGDEDYKNGYYHDALKAYELVNFYEGYNVIDPQKISNIKTEAKKRAYLHYKNATKYLKTDKKRALLELNSVMMNDPDYKDTKELYDKLRNDRAMRIYINALENTLKTELINNQGSYAELKSIQKSLNNLAKYDYKNQSLQKARELLKKQKYMTRIAFKQSKKHNLAMANQALQQNHYLQAIAYAKKVLQLESYNKEAKKIIIMAEKKAKAAVRIFVSEGKRYYNSKNLDKANQCFEKALQIDKTNNTSLIYHKKIQRQLQTIKSLQ